MLKVLDKFRHNNAHNVVLYIKLVETVVLASMIFIELFIIKCCKRNSASISHQYTQTQLQ